MDSYIPGEAVVIFLFLGWCYYMDRKAKKRQNRRIVLRQTNGLSRFPFKEKSTGSNPVRSTNFMMICQDCRVLDEATRFCSWQKRVITENLSAYGCAGWVPKEQEVWGDDDY